MAKETQLDRLNANSIYVKKLIDDESISRTEAHASKIKNFSLSKIEFKVKYEKMYFMWR